MAWKICLSTPFLPATRLGNSCKKNIKQTPESTDTREGEEGRGRNKSATARQLLPMPCGFLVNDYSISGLTFLL